MKKSLVVASLLGSLVGAHCGPHIGKREDRGMIARRPGGEVEKRGDVGHFRPGIIREIKQYPGSLEQFVAEREERALDFLKARVRSFEERMRENAAQSDLWIQAPLKAYEISFKILEADGIHKGKVLPMEDSIFIPVLVDDPAAHDNPSAFIRDSLQACVEEYEVRFVTQEELLTILLDPDPERKQEEQ